jgi:chloramphenicol-sensitive protein RarD
MWGIFPIYWKLLSHVPSLQIVGHRVIWSFLFLSLVLVIKREWRAWKNKTINRHTLPIYIVTGILLGANWLVYVWGVNAGHIIETSLGYFINPLLSVLFGVLFLREHLRPAQWVTIGMAAIAVVYLTTIYGSFPWIALTLAATFSLYGLLKKTAPLGALYGLTIETIVLVIPSVVFLFLAQAWGIAAFGNTGTFSDLLLIGSGLATALPLLMFSSAARSIPLWMVGLLQYIAPTMQFLIGIFIYREPFTLERTVGFAIIWIALGIFWLEGILQRRQRVLSQAAD